MGSRNTAWRAFTIPFPEELRPIYRFLQGELGWALSDPDSRSFLESVDHGAHRGNQWREMHSFYRERVDTWDINNRAWFARILYENLRRELESKRERVAIYDLLENHGFKINSGLREALTAANLYPTNGTLRNLKASGVRPGLTRRATFQLDYTVSDKQMFRMESRQCSFKVAKGGAPEAWFDLDIDLPYTLSGSPTGRIAKPRFMHRRDGKWVGLVSYEIETPMTKGRNTLGVDLGKVQLFTARGLSPSGEPTESFTESHRTKGLMAKLERLYGTERRLRAKIRRTVPYASTPTDRQRRREVELARVRARRLNLKEEITRAAASEVVDQALMLGCGRIHLENLAWLESKGGKWDHSRFQEFIREKGEERGVRVVTVNSANSSSQHPISGEVGMSRGRDIVFKDGETVDRDDLAALNLACRQPGRGTKPRVPATVKKGRATPRRVKPKVSARTLERVRRIKERKEAVHIVTPSPGRVHSTARSTIGVVRLQNLTTGKLPVNVRSG